MKAVLIDAKSRTVSDVEYSGNWRDISPMLGCDCFTVVRNLPDGDDVYVDDEGLLKLTPESVFFTIPWYPTPLAGSGLIMSCDSQGESAPAVHDAEFYRKHVGFTGMKAVWLKEELEPTGWPQTRIYYTKPNE